MKSILISYLLIINLSGFFIMGIDKRKAKIKAWRVKERTLFLIALLFGSVGIFLGMRFFRHKTKHRTFTLGIPLILGIQLILCGILFSWYLKQTGRPAHTVKKELSLVSELDPDIIQTYIAYDHLKNSKSTSDLNTTEAAEAVNLFFKNFSYHITNEQILNDTATVDVQITNIDMQALAKDLCHIMLTQSVSLFPVASPENDYYHMLCDALKDHDYPLKETTAVFHLTKNNHSWRIQADEHLKDEIVGGFLSYLSSSDILPISEIVEIHLNAFKNISPEQWKEYLSIHDVFSTYNETYDVAIDDAYLTKLSENYDYRMIKCTRDGSNAVAVVRIKSVDMPGILKEYREKLMHYATSTRALLDDDAAFSDETARLLLESVQNSNSATSTDVEITLHYNDSIWEISYDSSFTDALMGNISHAIEAFQNTPDSQNTLIIEPRY